MVTADRYCGMMTTVGDVAILERPVFGLGEAADLPGLGTARVRAWLDGYTRTEVTYPPVTRAPGRASACSCADGTPAKRSSQAVPTDPGRAPLIDQQNARQWRAIGAALETAERLSEAADESLGRQ